MRLILYILALAIFTAAHIPNLLARDKQAKILDLAVFAFIAIAADITYRLRKTVYLFYPLVWGAGLLYRYLQLPYYNLAHIADWLVHIPLGIILILKSRSQIAEDVGVKKILLWLGILSLVFSLRIFTLFFDAEFLQTFFRLHLESYFIIGIAGKALLENRFRHVFTAEREVAILLIIISAVQLIIWLIGLVFSAEATV